MNEAHHRLAHRGHPWKRNTCLRLPVRKTCTQTGQVQRGRQAERLLQRSSEHREEA